MNAVIFLVDTLFSLYLMVVLLRLDIATKIQKVTFLETVVTTGVRHGRI
jgi:hypothetical protein